MDLESTFVACSLRAQSQPFSRNGLWDSLDTFQKMLLATDGTLTLLLSAYFGEEISLKYQAQEESSVSNHSRLKVMPNERVLQRRVVLVTSKTERRLAYCEAEIAIERIDTEVRDRLLNNIEPIGLILRGAEIETFRKMISWGVIDVSKNVEISKYFFETSMLYRTYSISVKGKPWMVVTEYFANSTAQANSKVGLGDYIGQATESTVM